MNDELGKRMKENFEDRYRFSLPRRTYTIIRLDGKAFHTFTKNFQKPFDGVLSGVMCATTNALIKQIQGCKFGYTQSDEISLLLTDFADIHTDAWFNGNIQKIVSISASLTTSIFNDCMKQVYRDSKDANFDSRVFTVPDPVEVRNYFIWRQKDAIRNGIQSYGQYYYSHKQLNQKSCKDIKEMLKQEHAIDLDNKEPSHDTYGTLILPSGEYEYFDFVKSNRLKELIPLHPSWCENHGT